MGGKMVLLRAIPDFFQNVEARATAPGQIGGVFYVDEARGGVNRAFRADDRLNVAPGQDAVIRRNGANQASGEHGRGGHLIIENVGAGFGNDFLSGLGERTDGHLVAHGAGRQEERGFAPESFGSATLEQVDGGVLAIDIVANFSGGHGGTHFRCGTGHSVGTQINDGFQGHSASFLIGFRHHPANRARHAGTQTRIRRKQARNLPLRQALLQIDEPSVHAEQTAWDILRDRGCCAPHSRHAVGAVVQSDDQQIDFMIAGEADDGIGGISICQVTGQLHTLALRGRSGPCQQLLIKVFAILFKGEENGRIGSGAKSRVRRQLFHHGDGLKPDAESFRKLDAGFKRAGRLGRIIVGYGNALEHRFSL
jgi:hypothetical protein